MIHIVVLLEVKEHAAFLQYESKALKIMKAHGGHLMSAYKPMQAYRSGSEIDEVHILRFPDLVSFENYRTDGKLAELADLRALAIANTKIYVSEAEIDYD